jgi:hypothetical protein
MIVQYSTNYSFPTLLKPHNIDVQRLIDQLPEAHNSLILDSFSTCNKITKKHRPIEGQLCRVKKPLTGRFAASKKPAR